MPRTRRYCPVSVIRSYARRAPEIDRAILAGFVLSTRKVDETLLSLLGRPVAPTTVSRVAKTLDAAVQARRPFGYKALMGVVLSRKTGAGALKRPAPVVLGLRPDGRKEIVDCRLARAESAAEWERFLDDLYARAPGPPASGRGFRTRGLSPRPWSRTGRGHDPLPREGRPAVPVPRRRVPPPRS